MSVAAPAGGMLTVKETAAELHVSERTVYTMIKNGVLPSYKIAGARRVAKADVARYLAGCRE